MSVMNSAVVPCDFRGNIAVFTARHECDSYWSHFIQYEPFSAKINDELIKSLFYS